MPDFKIVKLLDPIVINMDGPSFTGVYDNGTSYTTGESVSYNGSSYVAIINTTGNLPTDTTYWQVLAEKGNPGAGTPVGGTANQALTKIDGTNYNTQWSTINKTFVGLPNVQNLDQTDPTNITQNSTHRFATDAEKTTWNNASSTISTTKENLEWELARYLDNNQYYKKLNYTLGKLTSIEIYDDNTLTVLQYTKTLNYTLNELTSVTITRDIDSAVSTKTLNYTLGVLDSIEYN